MLGKLYTMFDALCFSLQADLKERYSVAELLADLAGCRASRVLLFVEQSYSGVLSKRLMGSLKHVNVVLLNGLPWVHTAEFWASLHPSQCLIDHLSKVRLHKPLSAPIPVPHRPPQQGETLQTFICTHPSAS